MSFILLVLALLGGGLICLLVVNTTLGATSFRISQLQSANSNLSLQEQTLQAQIQNEQAPAEIARRASQLGMRIEPNTNILDLSRRRFYKLHDPAAVNAAISITQAAGAAGTRARRIQVSKTHVTKTHVTKAGAARRRAARHRAARHRATATKAGSGR